MLFISEKKWSSIHLSIQCVSKRINHKTIKKERYYNKSQFMVI